MIASTQTLVNPTSPTLLSGADQTALTATFTKQQSGTRLVLRVAGTMQLSSGVAQNLYLGLRVGSNNYDVAQFQSPQAVVRVNMTGLADVIGLAAGSYSIQPQIHSGPATINIWANDDFISWEVEELS